jgi:hypothetical protein
MLKAAIEHLRATDQVLAQLTPAWSLCPGREHASSLATLGLTLLDPVRDGLVAETFAEGLASIAQAIARSFPGNLFWDLDYLAASLLGRGRAAEAIATPADLETIRERARSIVLLQNLFSHHSGIQFRYAHDFLYGFDWAKWVSREPAARASIGPFDLSFLGGMHQRGTELLELISHDDDKYPYLPEGQDRNPFAFSRDPKTEETLHRDLAEQKLIPLPAWDLAARPVWNRPYAELRDQRAHALGLSARGEQCDDEANLR